MREKVCITSVSNAGVLLTGCGSSVLVDALYEDKGHPFDPLPAPLLTGMLGDELPPGGADYLCFTHRHPDHFSAALTSAYLKHHPACGLLLPGSGSDVPAPRLPDPAPTYPLHATRGELVRYRLTEQLAVTGCGTGHMGPQYGEMEHCALLFDFAGRRVLLTGDSDFDENAYARLLSGEPVDAVLVNPLFCQHPKGAEIIREIIRPRNLILYHLPFTERNPFHIRQTTKRLVAKHTDGPYSIHVFDRPLLEAEI